MRRCAIPLLVLLLASLALAGQNPDVRIYLDFDPPNHMTRIDPEPYSLFDVYVIIDCFGADGGLIGTAFAFERTFEGGPVEQENLLGGPDYAGNVEDPIYGWALAAAGLECVYPDGNGMVTVARVRYFYIGSPGHIRIIPDQSSPGPVLDCEWGCDYWCVAENAGVNMDAPPGEPGCDCGPVPVETHSWGTVKALYR